MNENLVGKTLADRYEIIELVGTGGMASVYKAHCNILKRDVAVKVLRDSVRDDDDALKSFKQEAQAAAQLAHNNIVQIYDVCKMDGVDYMVMEFVEGVTLKKYIKENGPLSWQEACDFATQIAQALEAAHSKGVVHRDIKPQNILVTADKVLKVTDFGIAKATNTETLVMGNSKAMGSVHYISPEQARGGFTDARSDIYSLGMVLFEMLTGTVPFNGESAVAVALMHIEQDVPSVFEYTKAVPGVLADVVAKMVTREQSGRYQTATDIISDLHDVMASNPTDVIVPSDDDVDDMGETRQFNIDDISNPKKKVKNSNKDKKNKKEKTEKTPEEKKADRTATILAFLTVILIILAAVGIYSGMKKTAGGVIMPDFTGSLLEEAAELAEQKGITISSELEYSISDDVEEGRIISQIPEPKSFAMLTEPVRFVVSIGSSGGNIAVPYVKGMGVEDAISKLLEANLMYLMNEEYSDTVPLGQVIRQTPEVGTKLNQDDVVTIHVSTGKPPASETPIPLEDVVVPNLYGETQISADGLCNQWNLKLVSVTKKNSEHPAGTVISQSPEAGQQVRAGTNVSIVISTGISDGSESFVAPTVPVTTQTPTPDEGEDINEVTSQLVTKEFTMQIPEGSGTVNVKITLDGKIEFERNVSYGDTVSIDVSGKGKKKLVVYFDGKSVKEETIVFE